MLSYNIKWKFCKMTWWWDVFDMHNDCIVFVSSIVFEQWYCNIRIVLRYCIVLDDDSHHTTILRWYKEFQKANFSLKNDKKTERSRTSVIDENVTNVRKMLDKDRLLTYQIRETLGASVIRLRNYHHVKKLFYFVVILRVSDKKNETPVFSSLPTFWPFISIFFRAISIRNSLSKVIKCSSPKIRVGWLVLI